jgi:hypothetical protein
MPTFVFKGICVRDRVIANASNHFEGTLNRAMPGPILNCSRMPCRLAPSPYREPMDGSSTASGTDIAT